MKRLAGFGAFMPPRSPLCPSSASAAELAAQIRSGAASSEAVVGEHIDRIRRVNPRLNAVVRERFQQAMVEARAADARLEAEGSEAVGPLHGVPCTIKESFAVRGMPNSAGLVARRHVVADSDATAVQRLRAAGAIVMGVTNVSELCMWMESNNRVYGRTSNPYDQSRIVGGSSGGEGAIVGAGASPFGLGSDIGGSIRGPAFFNGVFGHKPTGGLVPGTGQYPIAHGAALRYLTTGPLARRAEDLMPLLRILAGPDGIDTGCLPLTLGDPDQVSIDELVVHLVPDNGRIKVSREMAAAQRRAAEALEGMGATVRTTRIAGLRHDLEMWSSMLGEAQTVGFDALLGEGTAIPLGKEFARWLVRRSPHTLPALVLALAERATALVPGRTKEFVRRGQALRQELVELLGDKGVLLYPPYPTSAPQHRVPMLKPFGWVYTAILNVMELPATQVPLGLDSQGLPLGIQVVARHGQDHVTIAVAKALEGALGGWVPPEAQ